MAYRIIDLDHEEIVLPEFLVDAVSDVLVAYATELELEQNDYDYQVLIAFADDVTQMVLQALRKRRYGC